MQIHKTMPLLESLETFYKIDVTSPSGLSRIKATQGPNGKIGPVVSLGSDGYWRMKFGGEFYRVNRIIYYMAHRTDPGPLVVDHIDGNRLNNRIENLRACTQQENRWNSKGKLKHSGLPKGITSLPNGQYRVSVSIERKPHFSVLDNFRAATCCLRSLRSRHHGEYARA